MWPGSELPRTEGTRKLKRRELRAVAGRRQQPAQRRRRIATGSDGRRRFWRGSRRGARSTPSTTIDELGLSSLERVELMMALEEAFQMTVDEAAFAAATTVADLEALVEPLDGRPAARGGPAVASERRARRADRRFRRGTAALPVRALRRASLPTWILPLGRVFARIDGQGLEHLDELDGPVIFAANHQSHLDTPVILDRCRRAGATASRRRW